ncbi:MAG TPA: hypothetical protein V6C65_07985, partial [Allocoleopsis sp.]
DRGLKPPSGQGFPIQNQKSKMVSLQWHGERICNLPSIIESASIESARIESAPIESACGSACS